MTHIMWLIQRGTWKKTNYGNSHILHSSKKWRESDLYSTRLVGCNIKFRCFLTSSIYFIFCIFSLRQYFIRSNDVGDEIHWWQFWDFVSIIRHQHRCSLITKMRNQYRSRLLSALQSVRLLRMIIFLVVDFKNQFFLEVLVFFHCNFPQFSFLNERIESAGIF